MCARTHVSKDIESDPGERYPLLSNQTWDAHLNWLGQTRAADSPLRTFLYYTDIGGIPTLMPPPAEVAAVSALGACGTNSTKLVDGTILDGYSGASLPSGDAANRTALLADCEAKCCADNNCAAFVLQTESKNAGVPIGSCKLNQPCCWLVHQKESELPHANESNTAVAGYPRGQPVPPPPGPPVPPEPPVPPGYYADVLKEIDAILEDHLAKMVRGSIPGGAKGVDLTPCGGGGATKKPGEECTINYPNGKIP